MSEIKIRKALTKDCDSICEICSKDLGYQCESQMVKEKIEKIDNSCEAVFVAVTDDKVVGYIHISKYDTLYFETMANILGLAVKEEYQHNGIGKKLVAQSEMWAVENKIKIMRLNSGISRVDAHNFYRHLGYNCEKEQIRFMKKV